MPSPVSLLVIGLSLSLLSLGDYRPSQRDFSDIDRHARATALQLHDLSTLAQDLTQPYVDTLSKVRAIYTWIVGNITYDRRLVRAPMREAVARRSGVCRHYSLLFDSLCRLSGIPAVTIVGWTKSRTQEIGKRYGPAEHTWNAVYFNRAWHLMDLTWAAGKESQSIEGGAELYFMADPQKFGMRHHPRQPKWQLTGERKDIRAFSQGPLPHRAFLSSPSTLEGNPGGILRRHARGYYELTFLDVPEGTTFQYAYGSPTKARHALVRWEGRRCFVRMPAGGVGDLTVYGDLQPWLSFRQER